MKLDSTKTYPELADKLYAANAGQCWSGPQEMSSARSGDYPHGTVDDCDGGFGPFQRIWHDPSGVWLNMPWLS